MLAGIGFPANPFELRGHTQALRPIREVRPVDPIAPLRLDHGHDVAQVLRRTARAEELQLLEDDVLGCSHGLLATIGHRDQAPAGESRHVMGGFRRHDQVDLQSGGNVDQVEHAAATHRGDCGICIHVPLGTPERSREYHGLPLVHAHDDVDVVGEARLAVDHGGNGTGGEPLATDTVEHRSDDAQEIRGPHHCPSSRVPAIRDATSRPTRASSQSGCCALTPAETKSTAECQSRSSADIFCAADWLRRNSTSCGSQRSSAGCGRDAECMRKS